MAALSPAIRSGPLAVLVALALAAAPAIARDASAQHHYSISGSLMPASAPAKGGSLQMQSRVSPSTSNLVTQAGDQFVLVAKLADRPDVCGSDTIFENGFDP